MINLLIEATSVGIILIIVSFIIVNVIKIFYDSDRDLPEVCKNWNKNHIMELSVFLVCFFTHLLLEFIGLNKWYVKHGVAAKNL